MLLAICEYVRRANVSVTRRLLPVVLLLGAFVPSISIAGCSYTGFCGTIAFLGWTQDMTKAVFLSQTVQAGSYVVQPTEGVTIDVDSWTTTAPAQRISVSPRAASYGGTHVLYSMNGGQAFVDSAYQGVSTQVFPNNYRSPDSIPHPTVTHVVINASSTITETTVNSTQAPVAVTPTEEIVGVQAVTPAESKPPALLPPPIKEVLVPQFAVSPQRVVIQAVPTAGIEKQENPGAVVSPPAQQTILQPTVATKLPEPPRPLVQAHSLPQQAVPVPHVTVPSMPLLVVEKQANPGAVVSPPAQQTILQPTVATKLPEPPRPLVQVQSLPQQAVPVPHVTVPAMPLLIVEKQANPGAIQSPVSESEILIDSGNGIAPTHQPNPPVITASNQFLDHREIDRHEGLLRPAKPTVLSPCIGDQLDSVCTRGTADNPRKAVWIDVRELSIDDRRAGIDQHSKRRSSTFGIESLERNRIGYGVAFGYEMEKGTILNRFVQFQTEQFSFNPYVSYRLNTEWNAIAGAGYKYEKTSAGLLSLKGSYVADHYSALLGGIGMINVGRQWLAPSFFYNRTRIDSKRGKIQGMLAGTNVDVVTQETVQSSDGISAGIEWGTMITSLGLPRSSLQAKFTANYDLTSGNPKPWSGDLRLGTRAFLDKMTSLEIGFATLGIGQHDLKMNEIRIALVHGF